MKKYLDKNVYQASNERIKFVFDNFGKIYVSFSGGKDSSVLLNLVVDYIRKKRIKKKVGVLFIDLEGQYSITIDFIKGIFAEFSDVVEPYWCCLPLTLRNAVSVFQPFWTCWDLDNRDKWVREYPEPSFGIITEDNNPLDFFHKGMEFEEFVVKFTKWYSKGKKTACLVGIRSDESLNRFRTIKSSMKSNLPGKAWTTRIEKGVYNCYPIYDWTTKDIWVANGKFGWQYNPLYDLLYRAGVPISGQRICQPYGDDQRIGLNLFRVIENDTWAKVVNRVSGANFGNIYCGTKALGYRKVDLPAGHTWRSYCKMLLGTLPKELSRHYRHRFAKFIRFWKYKGCTIPREYEQILPSYAVRTSKVSYRSGVCRARYRYKKIPDKMHSSYESLKLAPSWRRMCVCILKNDILCKSLSFSQTTKQRERMQELLLKYKKL